MWDAKNQILFIVKAIEALDLELIGNTLDESLKYQNFEKQMFLSKLGQVFKDFQALGDTYLESQEGKCDSCSFLYKGFSFIGNNSKSYIDLIIQSDESKITDIFECDKFKTSKARLSKKRRHYISDIPF